MRDATLNMLFKLTVCLGERHMCSSSLLKDEMAEREHLRFAQGAVESALALCEDSTVSTVVICCVYSDDAVEQL